MKPNHIQGPMSPNSNLMQLWWCAHLVSVDLYLQTRESRPLPGGQTHWTTTCERRCVTRKVQPNFTRQCVHVCWSFASLGKGENLSCSSIDWGDQLEDSLRETKTHVIVQEPEVLPLDVVESRLRRFVVHCVHFPCYFLPKIGGVCVMLCFVEISRQILQWRDI